MGTVTGINDGELIIEYWDITDYKDFIVDFIERAGEGVVEQLSQADTDCPEEVEEKIEKILSPTEKVGNGNNSIVIQWDQDVAEYEGSDIIFQEVMAWARGGSLIDCSRIRATRKAGYWEVDAEEKKGKVTVQVYSNDNNKEEYTCEVGEERCEDEDTDEIFDILDSLPF